MFNRARVLETANKALLFRLDHIDFYRERLIAVSAIYNQVYFCSGKTFSKLECVEAGHIVMQKLTPLGLRFLIGTDWYNPYSRTTMQDVPNKVVALGPLLG